MTTLEVVMSQSQLIKNTTIYALGDIIPKLLSFLIFPILTQYLAPEDYAIVNYVNTINAFLTVICFLCLNTYYLVYYYRVGDSIQQAKLLGNLSIFIIAFNIILTIFFYLTGNRIFGLIGSDISFFPYIAIGIATNFFNILSVLPAALFRVREKPLPLTLLNILRGVLTLGLTLVMVIGYGYKALGVLYSGLIISFIFGLIFLGITLRHMVWGLDWKQIKHALIFSLPLLPGALAYYIVTLSDRIFIEKYLDLFDLGIYSTAATIALVLNIVSYGAYKAFEPYFFKIYGSDDFTLKFSQVFYGFLFVILFGAMGLSIFSKEFILIFTNSAYHTAYHYVPLILIGVIASSVRMLFSTVLTAQNKTKINSIITIIGGAVSVTLNIWLLTQIGLFAACISSAISTILMLYLSIVNSKIHVKHNRPIVATLLCFMSIWFCTYVITTSSFWLAISIKIIVILVSLWLMSMILKLKISSLSLLKKY